jgi:glycosyltransferase involved in cell wall biosynthesis
VEDSALDISLVICTFDRLAHLSRLLSMLLRQQTSLRFEIIVVDNHPPAAAAARQEGIKWIEEPRTGLLRA